MSWGEGEYHEEWWQSTPDNKYFCANCGVQIYYPYKWRNVDKSQSFTGDWNIIKFKIYIQTHEDGKHIRLCDDCDKLFTTKQLIKLFLINKMGKKGREGEKIKKWKERKEKKRQKVVNEFGKKIEIHELCPDCDGDGMVAPSPSEFRKECEKCLNGKTTKLISIEELKKLLK